MFDTHPAGFQRDNGWLKARPNPASIAVRSLKAKVEDQEVQIAELRAAVEALVPKKKGKSGD